MLRFPIKILFEFLIRSFLISNNRFREFSLMDLLLAWFTKFIILFSLERSQEDMLKACVCYFLSNFCSIPNDSPSKTMASVFYFI